MSAVRVIPRGAKGHEDLPSRLQVAVHRLQHGGGILVVLEAIERDDHVRRFLRGGREDTTAGETGFRRASGGFGQHLWTDVEANDLCRPPLGHLHGLFAGAAAKVQDELVPELIEKRRAEEDFELALVDVRRTVEVGVLAGWGKPRQNANAERPTNEP